MWAGKRLSHSSGGIQSKLDDALALYDTRGLIEEIKTDAETSIKEEIDLLLEVEKAEQALRNLEADYARLAFTYEENQTEINIQEETTLKERLVVARKKLSDARMNQSTQRDAAQTTGQKLISNAHKATYHLSTRDTMQLTHETEYISGE